MITFTVRNKRTKKVQIECFSSKDKAEVRLQEVLSSKELEVTDCSYDTDSEKAICDMFLETTRNE